MKLLFDENLSERLKQQLADLYPDSRHVQDVGLSGANDGAIWTFAKEYGFAIVSKDSDFAERSVFDNDPPKVVWLRVGNCATREITDLLRAAHPTIERFIEKDTETCLLLRRN